MVSTKKEAPIGQMSLNQLVKEFSEQGVIVKIFDNPEKALELALQVEKDAVLYYMEAHAASKKRRAREARRESTEAPPDQHPIALVK